jgi:hypothetical protein
MMKAVEAWGLGAQNAAFELTRNRPMARQNLDNPAKQ